MRSIWVLLFLSMVQLSYSQGIDFQSITFEEALSKAKKEDKLIFIDFYTVWCAPCKALAKGPFLDPEIGAFYNENFINLKLDAEKQGKIAAQKYKIKSYPTLLLLDGEGRVLNRGGGAAMSSPTRAIAFAEKAINSRGKGFSIGELSQLYPQKKDDEVFLKRYFNQLLDYKMDATHVVEDWMKIQTEVDEASREMMAYLLNDRLKFSLGSKAVSIFTANYENYEKIANPREKKSLSRFELRILENTLAKAYAKHSPKLMELYIQQCKEKQLKTQTLPYLELEYLRLSDNSNSYKAAAIVYVDSLIKSKPIKEIKRADKKSYKAFLKANKDQMDKLAPSTLQSAKSGKRARMQVQAILKVSNNYLPHCNKDTDFKALREWIEYCYKLLPEDYEVISLDAEYFFATGNLEQAIKLKQKAIDKVPTHRVKIIRKLEMRLEAMKKQS